MMTPEPRPANMEPRHGFDDAQLRGLNRVRETLKSALEQREEQAPLAWAELETWQKELAELGLTREDFRRQVVNWLAPELRRCLAAEPTFRIADHSFHGLDELAQVTRRGEPGAANQLVDALAKAHGDPRHPLLVSARESLRVGWPESSEIARNVEEILTAEEPGRDGQTSGWLLYWALEGGQPPQLLDGVVDSPEELLRQEPRPVAMGLAGFRDGRLDAWLLRRTMNPEFIRRLIELKATRRMQELRRVSRKEWLHCLVQHARILLGETAVELGSLRVDLSRLDSVRTSALSSEEAFKELGRTCTNGALKDLLESAVIARRHPATTFEPMMTTLGAISLREDAPPEANANRVLWALGDRALVHWVDGAWVEHRDPAEISRLAEREWERFQSPASLQLLLDWVGTVDPGEPSRARAVAELSSKPEWNLYDLLAVLEDPAIRDEDGSPISIRGLAWSDLAGSPPERVFREVIARLGDMGHLAATLTWSREGLRRWCRWRWPELNHRVEQRFRRPSPVEPPPEAWLWQAGWDSLWLSDDLVVNSSQSLLALAETYEPVEHLLKHVEIAFDDGRLLAWVRDDGIAERLRALRKRTDESLAILNRTRQSTLAKSDLLDWRAWTVGEIAHWLTVRDRAVLALEAIGMESSAKPQTRRDQPRVVARRASPEWIAVSAAGVGHDERLPVHGIPTSGGAVIGPPCRVKHARTTCYVERKHGLPSRFQLALARHQATVSVPGRLRVRMAGDGAGSHNLGPLRFLSTGLVIMSAVAFLVVGIDAGFAPTTYSAWPGHSRWLGELIGVEAHWIWISLGSVVSLGIAMSLATGLYISARVRALLPALLSLAALCAWCWGILFHSSFS